MHLRPGKPNLAKLGIFWNLFLLLLQLHAIYHPPRWIHACVKNTDSRARFDRTGHNPTQFIVNETAPIELKALRVRLVRLNNEGSGRLIIGSGPFLYPH